jgi:hypothetical protein
MRYQTFLIISPLQAKLSIIPQNLAPYSEFYPKTFMDKFHSFHIIRNKCIHKFYFMNKWQCLGLIWKFFFLIFYFNISFSTLYNNKC